MPNACETKMVMTMNCRSLINFFQLRCCERAQWRSAPWPTVCWNWCCLGASYLCGGGSALPDRPLPEGRMCCGRQAQVRQKYSEMKEKVLDNG